MIGDKLADRKTHEAAIIDREIPSGSAFPRSNIGAIKGSYSVRTVDTERELKAYMKLHGLSLSGLARLVDRDRTQIHRLCNGRETGGFVGLDLVDHVFTQLGLPLPDLYVRAWIREDCAPPEFLGIVDE